MSGGEAWVTLATNDSYSLGAIVLSRSLKRSNTTRKLVVMITPGVSTPMRDILNEEFDEVVPVNVLDSEDAANLALLKRPELGITFTKLHCWRLTQYSKCVFLDADTLVLQSCDELFGREEFSAAPDSGWPDCFNSGVFVFRPSLETYGKLLELAVSTGSFDGGDQGLLNLYFSDWSVTDISKHLPFIYNVCASATYSYLPAYRVFGQNAKIVHFIGQAKPWLQFYDSSTGTVRAPEGQAHLQELLQAWWDIFKEDVHRKLTTEMDGESATMVEQVQSSMPQIFSSTEQSLPPPPTPQQYIPPPQHQNHNSENVPYHLRGGFVDPNFSSGLLVAIQRYPPENVLRAQAAERAAAERAEAERAAQFQRARSENNVRSDFHSSETNNTERGGATQIFYSHESESVQNHVTHDFSSVTIPNHSSCDRDEAQSSANDCPDNNCDPSPSLTDGHDDSPKGLAAAFAKISLEGAKSGEQLQEEEMMRKHAWEQGHIDYLGKDSFDNILKKIQASMAEAQAKKGSDEPVVPAAPSAPVPTAEEPQPEASTLPPPETSRSAAEESPAPPLSPGPTVSKQSDEEPLSPIGTLPVIEAVKEVPQAPVLEPEPLTQSEAPPATQTEAPPVAPSVEPPLTQTAAPPVTQTAAPPVTQSEATPVAPPVEPPVVKSEAAPLAQSEGTPVAPPVEPPVTKSEVAPLTQSEATPVAPPVEPLVTKSEVAPLTQSEATPLAPPVEPPVTKSEVAPLTQSEATPVTPSVEPPVTKSEAAPVTTAVPTDAGGSSGSVDPVVVAEKMGELEEARLVSELSLEPTLGAQKSEEGASAPSRGSPKAEEAEVPKAPPRKQSKVPMLSFRKLGVGISCVLVLAFAIYTTTLLPQKDFRK